MPETTNEAEPLEEAKAQGAADAAQDGQNTPAGCSSKSERTWTASEVDAYTKARIDKQNARHAAIDAEKDARIAELEEAAKADKERADQLQHEKELREWAQAASDETGIPASVIRGESAEEMLAHAQQIQSAMKSANRYPLEHGSGAPAQAAPSKDEILAIADKKERWKAINDNLGLFSN